jgi:hypothetical protein
MNAGDRGHSAIPSLRLARLRTFRKAGYGWKETETCSKEYRGRSSFLSRDAGFVPSEDVLTAHDFHVDVSVDKWLDVLCLENRREKETAGSGQ